MKVVHDLVSVKISHTHKKFIKFMSQLYKPDNQPFMINARTRLVDTFVERASQHAPLNILSPTF